MAARKVNRYKQGQVAVCRVEFRDAEGVLYDPDDVAFLWETPAGLVDSEAYVDGIATAVKRTGQGVYTRDLPLDAAGTWYYRFVASGSKQGADQHKLTVDAARPVAP